MKTFGGTILVLDRADINTDEIIPARYLTENSKAALKPYLLEDLEMEGFDPATDIAGKAAVISRENFGCGSSREHAPWALEVNGIHVVIAPNFARIFRQNMFNCGMLAIELDAAVVDGLIAFCKGKDAALALDLEGKTLTFTAGGEEKTVNFSISEYDEALVKAGGWVEYADAKY